MARTKANRIMADRTRRSGFIDFRTMPRLQTGGNGGHTADRNADHEPSTSLMGEKTTQEFAVKAIHDHGLDEPTRRMKFRIEWEGYPDTKDWTWEFEDELKKCYTLVQQYRLSKPELKNKRTCLKPIGGADMTKNLGRHNENDWPELENLKIRALRFLQYEKYQTQLEVIACTSAEPTKPTTDALMILHHAAHFYALLWLRVQDKILITDGSNKSTDPGVLQELENALGAKLTPVAQNKTVRVDHCGAAAISATMEFSRMYKVGDTELHTMNVPKSNFEKAVTALGLENSLPEAGRTDIRAFSRSLTCERCRKFRTTKGRGALLSHQRQKCKIAKAN